MTNVKKAVIVGAHGSIGQRLTNRLATSGEFLPLPLVREKSQAGAFDKPPQQTIVGDLEESIDTLTEKFAGAEAVIFSAGAGSDSDPGQTLAIDLEGAYRAMRATADAGAHRFIMISAAGADDRRFWDDSGMKPYYIAKHFADAALRSTELDYTIVRPVRLTDEPGTGQITVSSRADGRLHDEISRDDVAAVIETLLRRESHFGETLAISSGEQPIETALEAA